MRIRSQCSKKEFLQLFLKMAFNYNNRPIGLITVKKVPYSPKK